MQNNIYQLSESGQTMVAGENFLDSLGTGFQLPFRIPNQLHQMMVFRVTPFHVITDSCQVEVCKEATGSPATGLGGWMSDLVSPALEFVEGPT